MDPVIPTHPHLIRVVPIEALGTTIYCSRCACGFQGDPAKRAEDAWRQLVGHIADVQVAAAEA
jgi:hypothetical protein